MKIAMLLEDNRDVLGRYEDATPQFGPAPAALLEGLDAMPECEVHVVSCVQRPMAAPSQIGERTYYHALVVGKWGWLRGAYMGCIRAIRRQLRPLQPDVVHGQGTERYGGLSAAFSGYPNVITIHGNMRAIAKTNRVKPLTFYWFTALLEAFTLPRTGGVICNSRYTRSQVQPKARQCWMVPNALQSCFFKPRSLSAARTHPPVLLNIGTIAPHKCQLELLDLANSLFREGLKFSLHFIGSGDFDSAYGRAFLQKIEQARQQGYADHLGPLPTGVLIEQLDAAHALVHTPKEESFGLVVAEALARDLPLFGFKTGGIPDVVDQIPGTHLMETGNWPALKTTLSDWLRQGCPKSPPSSGPIEARFHPRHVATRHLEVYRDLCRKCFP